MLIKMLQTCGVMERGKVYTVANTLANDLILARSAKRVSKHKNEIMSKVMKRGQVLRCAYGN